MGCAFQVFNPLFECVYPTHCQLLQDDAFIMKKQVYIWLTGLFISVFALAGCNTESGSTASSVNPSASGSGTILDVDKEGGNGSFEYTHTLGSTPQDVYFIFTNTNLSDVSTVTTVSTSMVEDPSLAARNMPSMSSIPTDLTTWAREHGVGLKDRPEVSEFNARLPELKRAEAGDIHYQFVAPEPSLVSVGDPNTFMNSSTSDTIPATVRKVVTDGTVTLNIWVADDSWLGGCGKHYCMTQAMVDAFADKFLQAGSDNDIYDWVSSIYGAPWGTHTFNNLIASGSSSEIDILFFDIDDDGNDPADSEPNGGVLGFFWSKDNFLTSQYDYSNERLLFYMDSVLTAKDDSGWDITDEWPAEMVSTLAHEFQHMIHFYQKNVTFNSSSETWINEMASMVAEDLTADKIGVNGPRGVAYTNDAAGSPGNSDGRLPWFNNYSFHGTTSWYSGNSALINYGINYAFGAYLARNYGGSALFQDIVQRSDSGYQAITKAVTAMGYSETFTTLLQKWGVAVLLSDLTNNASGYIYNTGSGFSSTANSVSYNVGSVNLFNYDFNSQSGPFLYTPSTLSGLSKHYAASNTYVKVGTAETGTFTATVDMPAGVLLTVVTKDSN